MASHLINEAHALVYSGRFAEARSLVDRALAGARSAGARAAVVWFEVVLGEIDRDSGRAARPCATSPQRTARRRRRAERRARLGARRDRPRTPAPRRPPPGGRRTGAGRRAHQPTGHLVVDPLSAPGPGSSPAKAICPAARQLITQVADLAQTRRAGQLRVRRRPRPRPLRRPECGGRPADRARSESSKVPYIRALAAHARAAVAGDVDGVSRRDRAIRRDALPRARRRGGDGARRDPPARRQRREAGGGGRQARQHDRQPPAAPARPASCAATDPKPCRVESARSPSSPPPAWPARTSPNACSCRSEPSIPTSTASIASSASRAATSSAQLWIRRTPDAPLTARMRRCGLGVEYHDVVRSVCHADAGLDERATVTQHPRPVTETHEPG